uniref:Uncharacterized protein MANES_12G047900 n=1 Tax=Rhizophora mucronata TaxID=61149 RepID=A0A2P2LUM4_RHIMU
MNKLGRLIQNQVVLVNKCISNNIGRNHSLLPWRCHDVLKTLRKFPIEKLSDQ